MTDLERIAPLFDHWEETMIWSCLQGVMGRAVWNESRTAAAIISGDFGFLAGTGSGAAACAANRGVVKADRARIRGQGRAGDPVCDFEGAGRI